jgi:uncharacterized protein YecT (DUF1311 family)
MYARRLVILATLIASLMACTDKRGKLVEACYNSSPHPKDRIDDELLGRCEREVQSMFDNEVDAAYEALFES